MLIWKAKSSLLVKFFLCVWVLSIYLIDLVYESNLRANLVRVEFEKTMETEQDVLDASKDIFVWQGTGIYNAFKFATTPVRQQV